MSDENNAGNGNQGDTGETNPGSTQVPNPFEFLDLQTESYDPRKDEAIHIIKNREER